MWFPKNWKYDDLKKKNVAQITGSTCTRHSQYGDVPIAGWQRMTDKHCDRHGAATLELSFVVPANQSSSAEH